MKRVYQHGQKVFSFNYNQFFQKSNTFSTVVLKT